MKPCIDKLINCLKSWIIYLFIYGVVHLRSKNNTYGPIRTKVLGCVYVMGTKAYKALGPKYNGPGGPNTIGPFVSLCNSY